ncbi:MAG TPA: ACP S-malonyltransferase [Bacteroidaceae bacterium]|nr:ACP S-malonyltransferase [Bacteroidaceae bacterium]
MKAFVFPGQGAQFPGMGNDLYDQFEWAKELFETANEIMGFKISDIMFNGVEQDLRRTDITQPAVFIHSVAVAKSLGDSFLPDMIAGHSLGEFSALVAAGSLSFNDGLELVKKRAFSMQQACEKNPGTMAAIIALSDDKIEEICNELNNKGLIVVPANFNSPGQVVISGSLDAVDIACKKMLDAGAKRALPLSVGGAFHSPLMNPAKEELEDAINSVTFNIPKCPIYQNVDAIPNNNPESIKLKLVKQLNSPVRWTQSVINMIKDGADEFTECGPGNVLTGLITRIQKSMV